MFIYCMTSVELKHRLEAFATEQPVDRFTISESAAGNFQVELTLKPHTPVTERFIFRLEAALRQKIGTPTLIRIRRNVFIIRFALRGSYDDDSAADRIEELPTPYTCVA
jgi:hypothetical protein